MKNKSLKIKGKKGEKDILEKIKESREKKLGEELLKLSDSMAKVDGDVADLCIALMPDDDSPVFSMGDLMIGVQDIKNRLKESLNKE